MTGKSLTGINISSAKTMDDITMHLQSLMKSYMRLCDFSWPKSLSQRVALVRQRTLEKKDMIKVYDDLLSTFRQDSAGPFPKHCCIQCCHHACAFYLCGSSVSSLSCHALAGFAEGAPQALSEV